MLMQNELSVRMLIWSSVFSCVGATEMVASSALVIVCRSGRDLMSMCVMEFDLGFTCISITLCCVDLHF